MARYQCMYCGFVYDEEAGCPEEGIAPGTPFADLPEDWLCPDCGTELDSFQLVT